MPRLISRRKKPNPVPPCGRRIVYVAPHSPFQKLVESRRATLGLSVRDLAAKVSDLTPHEPELNAGSLWIWLRNQNGYPHPKSCTRTRLTALARVLRVPVPRLQESLDASRHLFTVRENPVPREAINGLESIVDVLRNDKRKYVWRKRILNIAEQHLAAARASGDRSRKSAKH
jgi:hypothetical protein